jgi:hypothetical protein
MVGKGEGRSGAVRVAFTGDGGLQGSSSGLGGGGVLRQEMEGRGGVLVAWS